MDNQDRIWVNTIENSRAKVSTRIELLPGELVRKSIHLLIALVPPMASLNLPFTMSLLAVGTLFYAFAEASRRAGRSVYIISDLTRVACRTGDMGRFVLGPITLGLGAMLALTLYPDPAASIAIYALAFGDGFASLAGKTFGGPTLPFLKCKTVSGSLACLIAVFIATLRITSKPMESLVIACVATVLEAVPFGNFDNLVIPFGVGLAATQILFI
jgi:dolichol kinase